MVDALGSLRRRLVLERRPQSIVPLFMSTMPLCNRGVLP